MPKRLDIAEQLRRAIQVHPESLYRIAKGSGVSWSVIHRFLTDNVDEDGKPLRRDLRLETAAKLATYLKLHLAPH